MNTPTLPPSPPYLPERSRTFISLRTKFVVFFSLILVLTCAGMSWYFIHSKRLAMTEQVRNLGVILVKISPTTSATASSSRNE